MGFQILLGTENTTMNRTEDHLDLLAYVPVFNNNNNNKLNNIISAKRNKIRK